MTNNDIRNAVDVINAQMNDVHNVILMEGDFIDPSTELTDTQVKQVFMVLSQASVYKKIQGDLNGYKPSIDAEKMGNTSADKIAAFKDKAVTGLKNIPTKATDVYNTVKNTRLGEAQLNELDPFSGIAKMKDDFMAKFGDKGAKMAQVARNTSQNIWSKWEKDSIDGGITPTVENLSKWINKKGVDVDLIDVAFRAVGVPNIKRTLRTETQASHISLTQWMGENDITPGSLNGNVLKDYLLDMDVQEHDLKSVIDSIGVKNMGTMLSKNQIQRTESIVKDYKPTTPEPDVNKEPDRPSEPTIPEGKPDGDWAAADVYAYVIKYYDVDEDKLANAFTVMGTEITSDDDMGDDRVRKLFSVIEEYKKPDSLNSDDLMDKTQSLVQDMGGSIGKAKVAGQKAVKSDSVSEMNELQKLGIAILTARKKI